MDGYNRIKELYLKSINKNQPLVKIVTFLMKHAGMNDFYLNENKNLEEMMKYINKMAKEKAINNVAVIEDETVYEWAITYFKESNEKLGLVETQKTKPAVAPATPPQDNNNQLTLEI